jgi:hypothetical protein
MQTDVARVEYRVGLKLAVGKYQAYPYSRTEFFGKKYLGKADLAKTAARRDNTDTAHYVCGNTVLGNRLSGCAVALGYRRVVSNSLPAVILNKAAQLIGKPGSEKTVELVV